MFGHVRREKCGFTPDKAGSGAVAKLTSPPQAWRIAYRPTNPPCVVKHGMRAYKPSFTPPSSHAGSAALARANSV